MDIVYYIRLKFHASLNLDCLPAVKMHDCFSQHTLSRIGHISFPRLNKKHHSKGQSLRTILCGIIIDP